MDPLSIIASIISIGGAAISSAQGLYNLVQSVRDAPEELTNMSNNVRSFSLIVLNLQTALDEDSVRDLVQEDQAMLSMVRDLKDPLRRCSEVLGQLTLKVQSRLKPTEDGKGARFSTSDWKWYFAKKEVNDLMGRLEVSRANVNTSLNSITVLCVVRLRAAGLKAKPLSDSSNKYLKDNDAGSALRHYVKEASIAGSLAPSIQSLAIGAEETLVAQSRDRTPSPRALTISNATERMRKADNQRTALLNAAKSGEDLNIIELVIEDGADINAKDADGMTALHFAAKHGKENAVIVLLQNGANVHARTIPPNEPSRIWERKFCGGRTPLHWAANEGYDAIVKILLDHHADPGAKSTTYRTPLQEALMQGHESVALILIEHGAPINDTDDEDWTPLHECCSAHAGGSRALQARLRLAKILIDRGAQLEAVTADENITGLPLYLGATPLLLSALTNRLEFIPLLVERGADPYACNRGGEMAIHIAGLMGRVEVINAMLDVGVEIDVLDQNWNETTLHKAASQGRLRATKLLLERGADPRAVNALGRDVLQHTIAVQPNGNPEIQKLLKERLKALRAIKALNDENDQERLKALKALEEANGNDEERLKALDGPDESEKRKAA